MSTVNTSRHADKAKYSVKAVALRPADNALGIPTELVYRERKTINGRNEEKA